MTGALIAMLVRAKPEIVLTTLPHNVYRQANVGKEGLESWSFDLLVKGRDPSIKPIRADVTMFSGSKKVKELRLGELDLSAKKGVRHRSTKPSEVSGRALANENEVFDLHERFEEQTSSHVSIIRYRLVLRNSKGRLLVSSLEVPIKSYVVKTKLRFPIKGNFTVVNGFASDFGHSERSQLYAIDIVPLGPHLEVLKDGDGSHNEDFYGWGLPVLADGDGRVVYARNDVPNQRAPGTPNPSLFSKLTEPVMAASGNSVVIDHLDGEYSIVAHMQTGSVRVHQGQFVTQGQVLGLVGSSGNAFGPHVHYNLMSGFLYRSDALPLTFVNVDPSMLYRGAFGVAN